MAWLDPLLRVSQGCSQDLGWAVLLSGAQGPVSFICQSVAWFLVVEVLSSVSLWLSATRGHSRAM